MKYSILIPVYNVEAYLSECIETVLSQTYKDFEIILVDDGSTDESGRICDEYSEKYPGIVKVYHKKNQGLISARRFGIDKASGDFCIFVDSDDFIQEDLLSSVNDCVENNTSVDIVLYSFYYYSNGVAEERKTELFKDGTIWNSDNKTELYSSLVFTKKITSIWTKAIRTSILKADKTDYTKYYDKNMAEDLLQSLYPITVANKVCYLNKALYYYRNNNSSISRDYSIEKISKTNSVHVYNEILNYLDIWDMNSSENKDRLFSVWFNDVMYQFSKCFENSSSRKVRTEILQFDWNSLLPDKVNESNKYLNGTYLSIYKMWTAKKYESIKLFFLCKKTKKAFKKHFENNNK